MARRENRKINIEVPEPQIPYVKIGQYTTYGDLLTIYNIKSNKQRKRQEF
jgi:hypothetical protein